MFVTCVPKIPQVQNRQIIKLHPETTSNGQKITKKTWALIATIEENPDITVRCPLDFRGHCESQCVRDV